MEYKNKIIQFSVITLIIVLADLCYFVYEKSVPPFFMILWFLTF